MTDEQARTAANVVLATAGVTVAVVVFRSPLLRRLAWRAVQLWLGASVPLYLADQVRQAWMQSART
jgi:hypothetical protein